MRSFAFMIVAAAMSLASMAGAGTITVTVVTATGTCSPSCAKTYTDTDSNLAKIIPTYQPQCNAKIGGTCTATQVLAFWFDQFIGNTVAQVTAVEKGNLANAATSGYVPINPQ